MRITRVGVVLLIVVLCAVHAPRSADAQSAAPPFVPGELIIKYRPWADQSVRARARARARAELKRQHRVARGTAEESILELVGVRAGETIPAALAALAEDPSVAFAEPNWIYRHHTTPNDPYVPQLWGLHNTGQLIAGALRGAVDADIDAPDGWARATGSPQVYVVTLDEGIDVGHQDLGADPLGPIWTNPYERLDGLDNDGNGYVDDVHGFDFAHYDNSVYDGSAADTATDAHGTHVSGTIGARANNGVGVAGVTWDVRIIPAKFLMPNGGTAEAAVRAIDYAVDLKRRHGLNIVAINASWGGAGFSQALFEAIGRAATADILLIAAAGNGGSDYVGDDNDQVPHYPANYDTTAIAGYDAVITVAATGLSDELAGFSNFGARTVDLGAPGIAIVSTTPQHGYQFYNGTSMAAPHVTGAAALVSAATGLTGRALAARLLSTVDRIASLQGRTVTGGRLNLASALGSVGASSPSLPSPLQARDLGAVAIAGSAVTMNGTLTVKAAGADIWGTADAFHYVWQPISGDVDVVARVTSVEYVHAWTKAGVMIREQLAAESSHASVFVTPGKGLGYQRRLAAGALSTHTSAGIGTAPAWVKLARRGNTITAFSSVNGATWTAVGSDTFTMPATVYVGLAVTSHDTTRLAAATFDSFTVTERNGLAAPWQFLDVGATRLAGRAEASGGLFTVRAAGADIWDVADAFGYVWQPVSGDVDIVARVPSVEYVHAWTKAGVMIREQPTAESPHAFMLVTPAKGLGFQRRLAAGGLSTHTSGGIGTAPAWVKLERRGNTITGYRSADGVQWVRLGSDTFAMGRNVYVGLAVTSHDAARLAAATFDRVTVTPR